MLKYRSVNNFGIPGTNMYSRCDVQSLKRGVGSLHALCSSVQKSEGQHAEEPSQRLRGGAVHEEP